MFLGKRIFIGGYMSLNKKQDKCSSVGQMFINATNVHRRDKCALARRMLNGMPNIHQPDECSSVG